MVNTLNKIALVQCYIHHVKDVEADISPPTNTRQLLMLETAYLKALDYFKN